MDNEANRMHYQAEDARINARRGPLVSSPFGSPGPGPVVSPLVPQSQGEPKRFLAVCEGGNVRSVGLAFLLKYVHGQDALAASWRHNTPETLAMLYEWATYIFVMQGAFAEKIPERFRSKLKITDVGPDRFMNPLHQELLGILSPWVEDWKRREWVI